jgi:hypothetical protein
MKGRQDQAHGLYQWTPGEGLTPGAVFVSERVAECSALPSVEIVPHPAT